MSQRQLTLFERYQISGYLEMDFSQKEISEEIGFSRSTISREIARNSRDNCYDPDLAHYLATVRRSLPRKARVITEEVAEFIVVLLVFKFVPEQISIILTNFYGVQVSTKSIYNFIRDPFEDREELARLLPRYKTYKRNKYKKYIPRTASDNRVSIDERGEEANNRGEPGHLEIDTIMSKGDKGGALTVCDRSTRCTWAVQIPDHKPSTITEALLTLLRPVKDQIHSITSDNGLEFREWEKISGEDGLDCDYYFCHPYSSWERGTIENTNGLIRRFYPKGTNFSLVDEKEFQFKIGLMNLRPRKCLDFKTPDELFYNRESFWVGQSLKSDCILNFNRAFGT